MVSGVEATHVANREIWKDSIENKLVRLNIYMLWIRK